MFPICCMGCKERNRNSNSEMWSIQGRTYCDETLLMALWREKYQPGQFTIHGFRATTGTISNGNKPRGGWRP